MARRARRNPKGVALVEQLASIITDIGVFEFLIGVELAVAESADIDDYKPGDRAAVKRAEKHIIKARDSVNEVYQ